MRVERGERRNGQGENKREIIISASEKSKEEEEKGREKKITQISGLREFNGERLEEEKETAMLLNGTA